MILLCLVLAVIVSSITWGVVRYSSNTLINPHSLAVDKGAKP